MRRRTRATSRRRLRPLVVALLTLVLALVLLAPPPAATAATTIAFDNFERSLTGTWGSASGAGGAWTVAGGSGPAVNGTAGVVTNVEPGTSMTGVLGQVSSQDTAVGAGLIVPATVGVYFSVEARRQTDGSSYRARAITRANGAVVIDLLRMTGGISTLLTEVPTPVVAATGQLLDVEIVAEGANPVQLKARTWISGTTAPDWQTTYSDSSSERIDGAGAVGLYVYLSRSSATSSLAVETFSALNTGSAPPPPPPGPSDRGAAQIGTTAYPVPPGAVFVSTSGNDGWPGTEGNPLRTVAAAIGKVPWGGTIVLRQGSYHESLIVTKPVVMQSYPHEAVWFDGSSRLSGFTSSGSAWRHDNWTVEFDHSPTNKRGAPDGTEPNWQWVSPAYPMAPYPDQVWIDGLEQRQVGSLGAVTAGTFYVDDAGDRLYLGSNPTGHQVEASTLSRVMSLRQPGTVIRGIGFRRYAPSVPDQGALNSYQGNITLENIVMQDSATGGIGLFGPGSRMTRVTIDGSGQLGFQGNTLDGFVMDNVLLQDNNDERFNPAPEAGGIKITVTQGLTLRNSEIRGTYGTAFWTDHSVYDTDVLNNLIRDNTRWGVLLELSSVATVANNVITNNGDDGIGVMNTDRVSIWNNTLTDNIRAIDITDDGRRAATATYGLDPRRPKPDPEMTWITGKVTTGNNILTSAPGGNLVVAVEDYTKTRNASDMGHQLNNDVFSQVAVGTPAHVIDWAQAGAPAARYVRLADFVAATGQERAGYSHLGGSPVNGSYQPVPAITSVIPTVAAGLPSSVASKLGIAAGTKYLGAWR